MTYGPTRERESRQGVALGEVVRPRRIDLLAESADRADIDREGLLVPQPSVTSAAKSSFAAPAPPPH